MTISATNSRIAYAGNGVSTAFSFPYRFLANVDLVVILKNNTTGVEVTKTLTTHYSVSGAGSASGGTVTMITAPATGETLTIYDSPGATQDMDLVENDPLPAETLEQSVDRLTLIVQRIKDQVERSVRLTDGFASTFDAHLPTLLTANKVLVVNSTGTGFDLATPAGITVVASGGGGSALVWVEDEGGNAPIASVENSQQIYNYVSALGQKINALIRVPNSYVAGQQIKLRLPFYSADTSGTALMQTVATLIRPGTDAMSSTTNQRTSTNSAVTLSASTNGKPQAVVFDLSDIAGAINSVSVAPGDLIAVQLSRGTDSATSDVKVPVYGAEVTFNG